MLCERKSNSIQGLNVKVPLKFRKVSPRSDEVLRRSFIDAFAGDPDVSGGDDGNEYVFENFNRPNDPVVCATGCPSTLGTLVGIPADTTPNPLNIIFEFNSDLSQLFNGILRFFVQTTDASQAGLTMTVELADSIAELGVNSDEYDVLLSQNAPDYVLYVVDLSQAPDTINGTGWGQSILGSVVRINTQTDESLGFSTLEWYPDIEDLFSPKLIKAYCLDGLSINRTYEVIEAPCNELISVSSKAIEFSVTVQTETRDLYEVMSDAQVEETSVLESRKAKRLIESFIDPNTGVEFGSIGFAEFTSERCVPTDVLLCDQCGDDGGILILRETPSYNPAQEISNGFFYVARGEYNTQVNNRILVNPSYIGQEVTVDYYVDVAGTKITETNDFKNVVMSIFWDFVSGDNRKRTVEIPLAVVTGFNQTASQTESQTWELTIQVPASDGRFLLQHMPNN